MEKNKEIIEKRGRNKMKTKENKMLANAIRLIILRDALFPSHIAVEILPEVSSFEKCES